MNNSDEKFIGASILVQWTLAGIVNSFWQWKIHLHMIFIGSRSICIGTCWQAVSALVTLEWGWYHRELRLLPLVSSYLHFHILAPHSGVCRAVRWRIIEGERKVSGPGKTKGGRIVSSSWAQWDSPQNCGISARPCISTPGGSTQGAFIGTIFPMNRETGSLHHSVGIVFLA